MTSVEKKDTFVNVHETDTVVKMDGPSEPLLSTSTLPDKLKDSAKRRKVFLVVAILAVLISGLAVCLAIFVPKLVAPSTNRYIGPFQCGTINVEFEEDDAVEITSYNDTVVVTDGMDAISAMRVKVPSDDSVRYICLIRYDDKYGTSGPPVLPRKDILEQMMLGAEKEPMETVMDDRSWVQDENVVVDINILPKRIQRLCRGLKVYEIRLLTDSDLTEKEDGENNPSYVPSEEIVDEYIEYGSAIESEDEMLFDLSYSGDGGFEDDTEDDFSGDISEDPQSIFDDFLDANKVDSFELGKMPILSDIGDDFSDPKDRVPLPNDDIERAKRGVTSDEDMASEKTSENEESNSNAPSTGLGEPRSDHNLGCCNHCRTPYPMCHRVCLRLPTNTYPYFYRNCGINLCQLVLPCAYIVG
ncbi:unnamed protein product [Clavelina lepadiformis]|uniref:Uncharacterized protein n=1 Tax=Clavelina lepadiformis TaxID=159417 RepID=A0ABP0F580_CLALP